MSETWDIEHNDIQTSPPSTYGTAPSPHDINTADTSSNVGLSTLTPASYHPSKSSSKHKGQPTTPVADAETPVKSVSGTTTQQKTMGDHITDALSASHDAQVASSQARVDAHLAIKEKKAENLLWLECMRMQFQLDQDLHLQQDQEAACCHDSQMMDKQIELECLKQGFAPSSIDSGLSTALQSMMIQCMYSILFKVCK